eukprot:CAMPEP_0185794066 /NCGR_PEP_ID=MMETSP1174-20130828/159815_1 /TAXON_ID=35687 /ORGANISM="Dictyocha speculum, Strain CCMP1381" /LENGTH=40 /DNA_ID= /DNA_START= /DNA_END= /DNA_ORIENTATION=
MPERADLPPLAVIPLMYDDPDWEELLDLEDSPESESLDSL